MFIEFIKQLYKHVYFVCMFHIDHENIKGIEIHFRYNLKKYKLIKKKVNLCK